MMTRATMIRALHEAVDAFDDVSVDTVGYDKAQEGFADFIGFLVGVWLCKHHLEHTTDVE
jgi:hypothetical protein